MNSDNSYINCINMIKFELSIHDVGNSEQNSKCNQQVWGQSQHAYMGKKTQEQLNRTGYPMVAISTKFGMYPMNM